MTSRGLRFSAPTQTRSRKTIIHIDSRDRTNPDTTSATNFRFNLSPTIRDAFQLENVSVEMPLTVYPINATNNILYWVDANVASITSTVPVGCYTASTLATEIGTQMTADTTDANTYTGTIDAVTKKMVIASSGGAFVLTGSGSNNVNAPIGLTDTLTGLSTYTLQSLPDLSHPRNIIVKSNLVQSFVDDILHTSNGDQGLQSQVLMKIPMDGLFGDIIMYELQSPFIYNMKSRGIDYIDFRLEDDQENLIDLNGLDWSMTLSILQLI
jgi:hypothetical protein